MPVPGGSGGRTAAGYRIARKWRPDVVFASAPPYSALIAASRVARLCGAPWVAELRDLWADNTYHDDPSVAGADRSPARMAGPGQRGGVGHGHPALGRIAAPPLSPADRLRPQRLCRRRFPRRCPGPPPGETVSILYTGGIYRGYRDPSPLFRAIALLGAERERIAVHFYGPPEEEVCPLAAEHGVGDRVFVHDPVPYKAALALQTAADVLLLLQWNDVRDAGNIPAKFFEYIGARRPILLLGYERGDLAAMIRERAAGIVANDPVVIAGQLRAWIAQRPAGIAPIAAQARAGMTRAEQYAVLERFLTEISSAHRAPARLRRSGR